MRTFEEIDFPSGVAERAITQFKVTKENCQEIKDFIYLINDLTTFEARDLIDEVFNQLGE